MAPGFLPRLVSKHGSLPQIRGIIRKMSLLRQQQQQQQQQAELHQKISQPTELHQHQSMQQQQRGSDVHQKKISAQQQAPPDLHHHHHVHANGIFMNEYEQYRRALCGPLSYKALLVDAAGTLIVPSEPAAKVYHHFGVKYGVEWSETEILARYRWAYAQPWSRSRLRYEDDARPFWRFIVENSTGCNDPAYLEELYQYYTTAEAWRIADPEAGKIFEALRRAGVKVAVVSNFDTRLRPLMKALRCHDWFDAMAISAEVGLEKPNPAIFSAACELLGVHEEEAVHVGDDRRNDLWGARDAGCDAWLWGEDVKSFHQVAEQIGVRVPRPGSFEGCPELS